MQEWIQNIFGSAVNPIVANIIIFFIIVLLFYILVRIARRLMSGTFVSGGKARHLRLAIMDATPVDSKRRLVLIRRDDVEHLILIGGPTDVVVEQNIKLAAQPAQRQAPLSIIAPEPLGSTAPIPPFTPTPSAPRVEAPIITTPVQPTAPVPAVRQYTPPPVAARPIQPIASGHLRTTEPATPSFEPRTFEPRPAAMRPVVTSSTSAERAQAPQTPRVNPPVVATAATAAAAIAPIIANKQHSLEDSLLVDLSNDIENATNEVANVSLEDEMESLLASLDTKHGRIG